MRYILKEIKEEVESELSHLGLSKKEMDVEDYKEVVKLIYKIKVMNVAYSTCKMLNDSLRQHYDRQG